MKANAQGWVKTHLTFGPCPVLVRWVSTHHSGIAGWVKTHLTLQIVRQSVRWVLTRLRLNRGQGV